MGLLDSDPVSGLRGKGQVVLLFHNTVIAPEGGVASSVAT